MDEEKLERRQNRARGMIEAAAVGDALGASCKLNSIQKALSTSIQRPEAALGGIKPRPWHSPLPTAINPEANFGLNTRMELCLLEGMLKMGDDREIPTKKITDLFYNSQKHAHDSDLKKKKHFGNSMARSTAALARSPEEAVRFGYEQSIITTPSRQSADCSRLLAYLCYTAMDSDIRDPAELKKYLLSQENLFRFIRITEKQQLKTRDSSYKDKDVVPLDQDVLALCQPETVPPSSLKPHLNWRVDSEKYEFNPFNSDPEHYGAHAMDGMSLALHIIHVTNSLPEAIEMAALMGGDADSVAAIVGQLAGAIYGAEEIPEQWVNSINSETIHPHGAPKKGCTLSEFVSDQVISKITELPTKEIPKNLAQTIWRNEDKKKIRSLFNIYKNHSDEITREKIRAIFSMEKEEKKRNELIERCKKEMAKKNLRAFKNIFEYNDPHFDLVLLRLKKEAAKDTYNAASKTLQEIKPKKVAEDKNNSTLKTQTLISRHTSIPVPTFSHPVTFFEKESGLLSNAVPEQPITDHPVVILNGKIASLNIWCPGSPIAPYAIPQDFKHIPGRLRAVLHETHHEEQMRKMAQYIFDILKSGVGVIAIQEMPDPETDPVNYNYLIHTLSALITLHQRENSDPTITFDPIQFEQTFVRTKGTRSGLGLIVNQAMFTHVSKPTRTLDERAAVYELTGVSGQKLTLHNIHGDFEKQQKTLQYLHDNVTKGDMVAGDLNVDRGNQKNFLAKQGETDTKYSLFAGNEAGNTLDAVCFTYVPDQHLKSYHKKRSEERPTFFGMSQSIKLSAAKKLQEVITEENPPTFTRAELSALIEKHDLRKRDSRLRQAVIEDFSYRALKILEEKLTTALKEKNDFIKITREDLGITTTESSEKNEM